MAGSLFLLRPLPGVDRPAIGAVIPTATGHTILLDAGANVDVRPQHLAQFAHLGAIYARDLMGIAEPRVGLLNIGEEPEKGNEQSVEAHRLLAAQPQLNFVGNIEGREVIHGGCDVLVCDGFVGNVLLKFYESVAGFIVGLLRREMQESEADLDFSRIFRTLDYTEYGGAPLLGVNGVTIICHGGSPPNAIRNAIRVAVQAVDSQMVSHIRSRLARLSESTVQP
jgi:phosphate acyltransferase